MSTVEVVMKKVRLHLMNNDYVIIFNMQNFTKTRRYLTNREVPHLWNSQSIEVKGTIYITGGSLANSKTYLNTTYRINENYWRLEGMANMHHKRDAHGIISWRNQHIIVVGSWHIEGSTKTCEIYNINTNKWQ